MPTINAYLNFNGNCLQAFEFYKSVFGGEFEFLGKFKDMPQDIQNCPPLSESEGEKIMHVRLPVSTETCLMGSDVGGSEGSKLVSGNNFSLSINTHSKEETDILFNKLAINANIIMPLAETFWGAYFGMLIDQFGVHWQVNYDLPKK